MEMEDQFNNLKEETLLEEIHKDEKNVKIIFIIIGIIWVIVLASIIYFYLTISVFKDKLNVRETKQPSSAVSVFPSETIVPTSCLDCVSSPSLTVISASSVSEDNFAKEYFITLGTGSNQTSDWADVPGAQATIDFGNYKNIKEIHFEASINLPTSSQIVSVRLFNKTDQHPVWYSEVASSSNVSAYLVSPVIIYDMGEKLYQVQMKTQLQSLANLTQSRIHIILK